MQRNQILSEIQFKLARNCILFSVYPVYAHLLETTKRDRFAALSSRNTISTGFNTVITLNHPKTIQYRLKGASTLTGLPFLYPKIRPRHSSDTKHLLG